MTHPIIKVEPLGSPWQTIDPFLLCAHHVDHFPAGNSDLGPVVAASTGAQGWRMYFGTPDGPNTAEVIQIWLNLPARNKMADPKFTMFWEPQVPRAEFVSRTGRTEVTCIVGALNGQDGRKVPLPLRRIPGQPIQDPTWPSGP